MKIKNLFIMPLLALVLLGCDSKGASTSTNSEPIASENESTSKVETSSVDQKTTSNDDKTTSEIEVVETWSEEEQALMKEYLGGHLVPYITMEGASWSYLDDIGSITYRKKGGKNEDCQAYFDQLMKDSKAIDIYGDDGEPGFYREVDYACEELESLRMVIYSYNNQFVVDVYLYEYLTTWPEAIIDEEIAALAPGKEINLPAPSVTISKYYAGAFISDTGDYLEILAFTPEESLNAYASQLETAGYVMEIDDYGAYYVDPTNSILVDISYLTSLKCLYIAVEAYYTFE